MRQLKYLLWLDEEKRDKGLFYFLKKEEFLNIQLFF